MTQEKPSLIAAAAEFRRQSSIQSTNVVLDEIYNTRIDLTAALITALKDIRVTAQIAAGQSSAAWIAQYADQVDSFTRRHEMLDQICQGSLPDGSFAEFGVFTGAVTRLLRPRFPNRPYHAFDSFKGVPESMGLAIRAGDFSLGGAIPDLPPDTTVHAGWFDDTVPAFRRNHSDKLAFVYVDCDLYASVKTVLDNLHDRFVPGAIIAFDDWYNFPNWEQHSYKALNELIERTGARFTPIGITVREHAVAFRYEGTRGVVTSNRSEKPSERWYDSLRRKIGVT